MNHLDRLEAESIHIFREVAAETENPVMLYSIGKDSSVMLHLAQKAFYPAPLPLPLPHIDTRWKFRDMYAFRNRVAEAELSIDQCAEILRNYLGTSEGGPRPVEDRNENG